MPPDEISGKFRMEDNDEMLRLVPEMKSPIYTNDRLPEDLGDRSLSPRRLGISTALRTRAFEGLWKILGGAHPWDYFTSEGGGIEGHGGPPSIVTELVCDGPRIRKAFREGGRGAFYDIPAVGVDIRLISPYSEKGNNQRPLLVVPEAVLFPVYTAASLKRSMQLLDLVNEWAEKYGDRIWKSERLKAKELGKDKVPVKAYLLKRNVS